MVILAKTKLIDAINEYPDLKNILSEISPKFKKIKNPVIFRLVSKWATFSDIAKMGKLSICELLHKVNRVVGTEKELFASAPECIKEIGVEKIGKDIVEKMVAEERKKPEWIEKASQTIVYDVRDRDDFFLDEILNAVKTLEYGQVLRVINNFEPNPLVNILEESGYETFLDEESIEKFSLYVNAKGNILKENWVNKRDDFEKLDVRGWKEDPFSTIIKLANDLPPGKGFKLVQFFKPTPLINLIEPMGFETYIEQKSSFEYHIYFFKKPDAGKNVKKKIGKRIPLVIQSATPVVYPVIMRILQSNRVMNLVKLEALKIWDKTEKHLAWLVNGQADISFSAVAAVTKIYQKGLDIKMKAVLVWDNFFILTRGYKAEGFSDLKGHKIYLPLVKSAPPYVVTAHLMRKTGNDPEEFDFVFGDPFGRPEEIKEMLVKGKIDTALLREPETSFAIFEGGGEIVESIKYSQIWEKLYPGKGNLPNAGIVFKGEIIREYPELVKIFLKETQNAIEWLNLHHDESAQTIFDIMGVNQEAAKLFLSRAHFEYVDSINAMDRIKNYVNVLYSEGYGNKDFNEFKELFG